VIGVIDYGASNLASVGNALDHLGLAWRFCTTPDSLASCDRLILPGVGHFGSAASKLKESGLSGSLRETLTSGTPLLGLCLGAQLLLEGSDEAPDAEGLGLIPGRVVRLPTRTVPHIGWNRVRPARASALFDTGQSLFFYFAHSFVCRPEDAATVTATTECEGAEFCVAIERGRLIGVQFHPEKSAEAGLSLLRRFAAC
jgi:imidazole glycerol phosphate synthase glutamine amidotransferase subunit